MKTIDEAGKEIENPDLSKGYIKLEYITVHHDAVSAVEQKSHFEVIKEYENCGKDVKEIIDVQGIEAKDAYDEKIQIQKYILYTSEELKETESLKSTPSQEERLKATEDALMAIMMGGTSNV